MEQKRKFEAWRYFLGVINALRAAGGKATSTHVLDSLADKAGVSPDERANILPHPINMSSFDYGIRYAAYILNEAEYIIATQGNWILTAKALLNPLKSKSDIFEITRNYLRSIDSNAEQGWDISETAGDVSAILGDEVIQLTKAITMLEAHHQIKILHFVQQEIRDISFEYFCAYLLRKMGYQHVKVTQASGDQGIDGEGIIAYEGLGEIKVVFQCKNVTSPVPASDIRDFRGAMSGRTDKGIFFTTSSFTVAAQNEANREGVTPIELVDGNKLVSWLEKYEVGLALRNEYEVDLDFLRQFKRDTWTAASADSIR